MGIILTISIILWTLIGLVLCGKLVSAGFFDKLNNKATLLCAAVLGPASFALALIGLAVDKFEVWKETPGFQKKFYNPEFIKNKNNQSTDE